MKLHILSKKEINKTFNNIENMTGNWNKSIKTTLFDVLYDGLTDIKHRAVTNDEAYEIVKRLQDVICDFRVMKYLDKLRFPIDRKIDTMTEYGWISIEKNGKKGGIIL